jgi:DNA-binding NarL/FixJ family response regulator
VLLNAMPGVIVVAEASNGREALKLAMAHQPQVVLMDIMMPEMNGLDATAQLMAIQPAVRVLILSMNATEQYVVQALQAGAAGYVMKDVSPQDLRQAIEAVASGEVFLSPVISKLVASGLKNRLPDGANHPEHLTIRQREVLQLLAEGNTTKQIAAKLSVSAKTIETHRMQLMNALKIHNIAGLVRYAIRHGVVTPDR